mmetsp:Transcript_4116/g.10036  ORF Transcript_4116/g.10036 Transcript_4116/m.10036 type:complete len:335 (-) Transcript_4116:383-1387(-)
MDSELGFRLRVEGSGFRVYILGFRVQGVEVRSRDPSTSPTLVALFMQPHARPRSHNLPIPVLSLSLSMARPDGAPPELLHGPECPPPAPVLCRADTGCTCSKVCAGLCAAAPPLPVTPPSLACCSWSQHPSHKVYLGAAHWVHWYLNSPRGASHRPVHSRSCPLLMTQAHAEHAWLLHLPLPPPPPLPPSSLTSSPVTFVERSMWQCARRHGSVGASGGSVSAPEDSTNPIARISSHPPGLEHTVAANLPPGVVLSDRNFSACGCEATFPVTRSSSARASGQCAASPCIVLRGAMTPRTSSISTPNTAASIASCSRRYDDGSAHCVAPVSACTK